MPPVLSRSKFIDSLREALLNLYNPYELKHSPLQGLLAEQRPESGGDLKQILINSVNELMPDSHTPYDTKEWKYYELLNYCFIDRLEQKEAAKTLLISLRTLQRLLPEAIAVLAEKLVADYHITFRGDGEDAPEKPDAVSIQSRSENAWDKETAILKSKNAVMYIDIRKMMKEISQIFQPISGETEGIVKIEFPEEAWLVMGQVTILRQAVLTAISYFNQQEAGQKIIIASERKGDQGAIFIRGKNREMEDSDHNLSSKSDIPAAMAHLMNMLKGSVEIQRSSPNELTILLSFPAQRQFKIMVIDDNADAIRLVEKYLSSGMYFVTGVQEPEQVILEMEKEQPALILMDVMLPNIDGWMLLSQIRRSPGISKIPVIISTILPQEELSFSLGADGFLRKPYTQQELLRILDLHLLSSPT